MKGIGFAGVDVGGGGVRVRVEAGDASAYGTAASAYGMDAGNRTDTSTNRTDASAHAEDATPVPRDRGHVDLDRLASRIAAVVGTASPARRFAGMAIGVTGLPGLVRDPGVLWRSLRDRFDLGVLVVAGDMVTTHVGALGFRPGVVVAAGTGVIALGTDLGGVWNQADGWGHLLGDHGGGAWVGAQGLRAALRAHDGRAGGSAALLDRMTARFGGPLDLVALVHESASPAHHLASFAPHVADAARAGDPVARRIWADAGRELGHTAVAAATGLDPVLSWGGRLFEAADLLMEPFQSTVRESLPGARFTPPLGASADGALALAKAAAGGSVRPRPPYLYVFTRTAARA
jgi:N-acetylglucosamine kinase-like BadF-type ATPase